MDFKNKLYIYTKEFEKIPAGVFIENPSEKISLGNFSITRRSLKHFVESRIKQNADMKIAIDNLKETLLNPEIFMINPNKIYKDSRLLGKAILGDTKALIVCVDVNNEIVSIHYKKIKQFNKIKEQISAGGEAASGTKIRGLPL